MSQMLRHVILIALSIAASHESSLAQGLGTLVVRVRSASQPVPQAEVRVGTRTALTDSQGRALLQVPGGSSEVTVGRFGFETAKVRVTVVASERKDIDVELEAESVMTEDIVVTATRNDRRVQGLPLRVEVVPLEEINEKLSMTPGDISMMLTETNGLRVQVTSPSLGAASVRLQGLRGRYTQILSDGLPLYGQSGSISLLQIPPMDLGQVEVIRGVASALFGPSALGGVVNLVSKRPQQGRPEREVLLNQTSLGAGATRFSAGDIGRRYMGPRRRPAARRVSGRGAPPVRLRLHGARRLRAGRLHPGALDDRVGQRADRSPQ